MCCRSQLLYLSCFNCMGIIGSMCDGLDNCIVLDMGQTYVSEGALQTLLDKVFSVYLNRRHAHQQCVPSVAVGSRPQGVQHECIL